MKKTAGNKWKTVEPRRILVETSGNRCTQDGNMWK